MKLFYYSVLCAVISILLFLYGFFLVNYDGEDPNDESYEHGVNWNKYNISPNFRIEKIVLMIIDGVRLDYFSDHSIRNYMPYVHSSLSANRSCVFPCRVHLPTVTMPRLKALTAGTIPNFVDIALNFGSFRFDKDNLLSQMVRGGKKIVFYGDDTWIKLFPDSFSRYEGTTSFFVSDFVEVDTNVTRNVYEELKRDDWDMMILHYLGLDHIGHVEGSASAKIPAKLQEMDKIIEKLDRRLLDWQKSYMMIVCGDHGMKDSGGHGGSTLPEVMVPLVTFGVPCEVQSEVSQVDVAITLATLLRLPIPASNVGKLIKGLVQHLPLPELAGAYYRNCEQLMRRFVNVADELTRFDVRRSLQEARNAFNNENFRQAIVIYEPLLDKICQTLIHSMTKYDSPALYFAILLALQSCLLIGIRRCSKSALLYALLLTCLLICGLNEFCYRFRCETLLCSSSMSASICSWIMMYIASFNTILTIQSAKSMVRRCGLFFASIFKDVVTSFLVLGSVAQIFSSTSTSFIEEEHMIWYFLWATLLVLIVFQCRAETRMLMKLSLSLIFHRVLRKLNQTGDKWSALPDINDWFRTPDNKSWLTVYTILGLLWTFIVMSRVSPVLRIRKKSFDDHFRVVFSFVDAVCLIMVFNCKAAIDEVFFPENLKFLLSARGAAEFHVIFSLQTCSICVKLASLMRQKKKQNLAQSILEIFIEFMMVWSSLLLRPYNIVLIGFLFVVSNWLADILKDQRDFAIKIVMMHQWIAQVYFFYQGNSNSFSSIDVTPGYVGQTSYNPIIAGIFIVFSTYAMPLLAYTCMIRRVIIYENQFTESRNKKLSSNSPADVVLCLTNLYLALFMTIISLQRNHLFIWSVFSPKLLYLCVYCVLLYPFLIGVHLCSVT